MPVYGTELKFNLPAGTDPIDFGDAFDESTENLGLEQGFYSIDAALDAETMSILVGVVVGDDVDPDDGFVGVISAHLFPALASIGIHQENISVVESKAAFVLA